LRQFQDYDIQKPIINLLEGEEIVKDLIDMLCLFVLQVTKKDGTIYPLNKLIYETCFFQFFSFFFLPIH
jgi:hypothetical protein